MYAFFECVSFHFLFLFFKEGAGRVEVAMSQEVTNELVWELCGKMKEEVLEQVAGHKEGLEAPNPDVGRGLPGQNLLLVEENFQAFSETKVCRQKERKKTKSSGNRKCHGETDEEP